MLTAAEIYKYMRLGHIYIEDFTPERLNPNSYNLRLGNTFLVYDEVVLDARKPNKYTVETVEDKITLYPNRLYLAQTKEYTRTHNLIPRIDGRSSIGRLGVFVHVTAGFGDIGFCGRWTLELVVVQPVIVYPGMDFCQISYHMPVGEIQKSYSGKYQNSQCVKPSKMWQDSFE